MADDPRAGTDEGLLAKFFRYLVLPVLEGSVPADASSTQGADVPPQGPGRPREEVLQNQRNRMRLDMPQSWESARFMDGQAPGINALNRQRLSEGVPSPWLSYHGSDTRYDEAEWRRQNPTPDDTRKMNAPVMPAGGPLRRR
jgi:hypothetical protein